MNSARRIGGFHCEGQRPFYLNGPLLAIDVGGSLPLIGAMLGHTQVSTTARYSHLADDPLRAAAERVGAVYEAARTAKPVAEVVQLPRKR